MASFSTCLRRLFCWWPPRTAIYHLSMKKLDLYPDMTKTSETCSLGSYAKKSAYSVVGKICVCLCEVFRKVIHHCMSVTELLNVKMLFVCIGETVVMMGKMKNQTPKVKDRPGHGTWNNEVQMVTVFRKTVNPQIEALIRSDQMSEVEVLLSDWLKCQSEEQDESKDGDGGTEWSDEEDVGVSEMSSENRELWESLINSDPYNPYYFCSTEDKLKVSARARDDNDDEGDEGLVSPCIQEDEITEWSEEEDSEMSTESRELWKSFNSDRYNPLCFSWTTGVQIKASEIEQNHTPSCPTASETEEHNPEQSTKKRAKKVRFTEQVTTHILEAWDCASQAARDGSCWMELARDQARFKRRVQKAGEIISPCLTAEHRDRVFDKIEFSSHSDSISRVQ